MKKQYNSSKALGLGNMSPDMSRAQKDAVEARFEAKADKHFKSQRELPNGRDFRWNSERDPKAERKYRNNFDSIFPNSPGAGI